ncbi:MAG: Rne/Rng family ribonuclease [Bacteroidetes bacterium]|nr:Rne/Rng family ribonuclease [Bacteroidota bacterium]
MSNELIIQKNSSGIEIALLTEKKLTEFHRESFGSAFQVGDFYLGKVKKISPTLNAAFVDIGAEKDAFLTYFDLGPNVKSLKKFTRMVMDGNPSAGDLSSFETEPQTVKTGKISQVFRSGEHVLLQILKEPIATKGPKATCDISLAGRYFVLVPFSNQISISRKIGTPAEKKRLQDLATSLKPENFGVIIRTVSEGVAIEELDKDLRNLVKKWDELVKQLKKAKPASLVLGEGNRVQTLMRDILNESFSQIVVNDSQLLEEIRSFLQRISPQSEKILKLHSGRSSVFEQYGVNRQIKAVFGKSVTFSGGAYLVIEHTEALHVIDVNSGSTSFDPQNRDENVLKVNLEAVTEIARQIRLRDMGGIIVIDFIDMRDPKRKNELFAALRLAMKPDRARHTILPMSKFGLVQITRERVRPPMEISTSEICPSCNGTGRMESHEHLLDRLKNNVVYLWENMNHKKLKLKAHPMVIAYLKSGFPSVRTRWYLQYRRWLKLEAAPDYSLARLEFFDSNGHVIAGE